MAYRDILLVGAPHAEGAGREEAQRGTRKREGLACCVGEGAEAGGVRGAWHGGRCGKARLLRALGRHRRAWLGRSQ
ncbi:unnamed protein product [Dovyalis caffra]|uniref:Uncharacterized protein n=1 Tax=Dovyalis caffra TaxID=77055 RepID=A0AAV1RM69_9ROSI|nr:unnamed protein product [Dovyalis caffra]